MKIKLLLTFFILLLFSSCGSSNRFEDYTQLPKLEEVYLKDFKLNEKYDYWEIRRGLMYYSSSEVYPDEVIYSFDKEKLNGLSSEAQLSLKTVDRDDILGFTSQCQPAFCPIYGVAIRENKAISITSDEELLAFFDGINTEAELSIWAWANEYKAKSYKEIKSGYSVVVGWDNLCGSRGEDLIEVESDTGIIIQKERLFTKSYDGCV